LKTKAVVLRQVAQQDIDEAVAYYLQEAGELVALRFVDALEEAFKHIAKHPQTGSPRYAVELDLAGVRMWALNRYPYLVFYVEQEQHVDIWRVLHGQRHIPAWLQDGAGW
jgi:toxin ParE1/3/4